MRAGHTAQAAANGAIVVATVLATVAIAGCRSDRAVAHDGPASSLAEAIRYRMYSSGGASRVPLSLHEAFTGNYSPIADYLLRWRADGTFDGLYLSITCAEDVPLVALDAAEM